MAVESRLLKWPIIVASDLGSVKTNALKQDCWRRDADAQSARMWSVEVKGAGILVVSIPTMTSGCSAR